MTWPFRFMRVINNLKTLILDLLFPVSCFGCKKEGFFLCGGCRESLVWIPPKCFVCGRFVPGVGVVTIGRTCKFCRNKSLIYGFFSPFSYGDRIIRELVHSFKYSRVYSIADLFAELLLKYFLDHRVVFGRTTLVIPTPLHKSRERIRGFNQAEALAEKLIYKFKNAGRNDLDGLKKDILLRVKKTSPQVELALTERRTNMINAFSLSEGAEVHGKDILLLDDVRTTGATMEEMARVLKMAGARRVYAVTVAH